MLFSREWLASYVTLPNDAETEHRLTFAGFSVEHRNAVAEDVVWDVDITSNRPDCMCHLGLARELSVLFQVPLRPPAVSLTEDPTPTSSAAGVTIDEKEMCPRFVARVVRGVRVGPSPAWLQARLALIGLRPINNIVDVTNFVLWETGQPLHAYDLARLHGARLVVRSARAGERLKTLDGVQRDFSGGEIIIADASRPVGLAGVMGGEDTEVSAATTDILLEGAHFDRKAVRTAARRFGMHTDASHRFERGTDPEGCAFAVARAAALIAEMAGGNVLAQAIDVRGRELTRPTGRLEMGRLDRFAGVATPPEEVERILSGLGFEITPTGGTPKAWQVVVPSWRLADFVPRADGTTYPADLFEEVLRITGFERIPATLPAITGSDGPRTPRQLARDRVRETLVAGGYAEAINFSFLAEDEDAAVPSLRPQALPIRLVNPLSERYTVLRRSVAANLLSSARLNRRRGAGAVRLFEIANVFFPAGAGRLPEEPEHLAIVCGGQIGEPWDRQVEVDLYDLKGAFERVASALGATLEVRSAAFHGLQAGNSAEFLDARGEVVGYFGQVADESGAPLFLGELSLTALETGFEAGSRSVQIPSRFPRISADLTFTHARSGAWSGIAQAIAEVASPELLEYHLKARFEGGHVPEGAVNTTIAFLYNLPDRSLTQDEVNARQQALAGELERRFGWRS
jgi:phenylalanyl-tRNA synthetase beta chain